MIRPVSVRSSISELSRKVQMPIVQVVTTENAWIDWQGITHLTEQREITVHPPTADAMQISVSLTLHPNEREVVLDLRRGEPGADGRFYSGMAIRFDNIITPGKLIRCRRTHRTDGHLRSAEPLVQFHYTTPD